MTKFAEKCTALICAVLIISIFMCSLSASAYTVNTIQNGDTNADGSINAVDVANLQKHIIGRAALSGDSFLLGDTNGDGVINAVDVANLQKHIIGRTALSALTYISESQEYIDPAALAELYATELAKFPDVYKPALNAIHAQYPNYIFSVDYINIPFWTAVENECVWPRKLVNMSSDGVSWRSMASGSYNWSTKTFNTTSGNWTGASKEVVAYYMDPRNFLNINSIYMFAQQSYSQSQTISGVNSIISDTFLAKNYTPNPNDPNDMACSGSYATVIMEAAKISGVSPYIIASTIRLEQGVDGSSDLISGTSSRYPGCYNFFNYKASGSTTEECIENGLNYAQSQGWTSRYNAIVGGAKLYAQGYIAAGQDTYYYKDFDVLDDTPYTHQYAQSVYDARSSQSKLRSVYISNPNAYLTFRIPVYADMPSQPPKQPVENEMLNNYYILSMSASGLSPSFDMFKYNYSLSISGNTTVSLKLPAGASFDGASAVSIPQGTTTVTLPIKAQTGAYNYYYLNVSSTADCTLTISVQ